MGEMKHTPGPWRVDARGTRIVTTNAKIGGDATLFDVRGWGYLTGHGHGGLAMSEIDAFKVQMANATLGAAAPDLLKELGDLVELLDGMRHNISWEVSMDDLLAGPRAALSKASPSEGGEA